MSRGAGALERAITKLISHRWWWGERSTEQICRAVYPGVEVIEKKHRVAVLQVLHRLMNNPPRLGDERYNTIAPAGRRGVWKSILIDNLPDDRTGTAYHEAGHALARLYFGDRLCWVKVNTYEQTSVLKRLSNSTVVGSVRIVDEDNWYLTFLQNEEKTIVNLIGAQQAIIDLLAGVIAEAHYKAKWPLRQRGISLTYDAMLRGPGSSDKDKIIKILTALSPDPNEQARIGKRSQELTQALIRSEPGWRFIELLAAKMLTLKHGTLGHRACARMFQQAFGRPPPARRSWDDHWPPTLGNLRMGWLPLRWSRLLGQVPGRIG